MEILETERLLLRAPGRRDAADLYEYAQTELVGPMAGWRPHASLRETRRVLKRYRECGYIYAVCSKADGGRMIGTAGLHPDEKRADTGARMLGYAFNSAYWGRGYATEAARRMIRLAFEDWERPVLSAYCFPENTASRHVLEKCGFVYEGCLRASYRMYDGRLMDSLCFSITPEEWTAAQAAAGNAE